MTNERSPEAPERPPNAADNRLRDANEQLTLTSLQALQRAEEAAQCYQEQTRVLSKKQEELRALASELALTEYRERNHLAMELHDYLAQMLVVGRLKIGQARHQTASVDPSLVKLIDDLDDIFSKSLDYTRTLMAQLRPLTLRESGLPVALKRLGEQMVKHGLSVEVHASHDYVALPDDQAMLLYQSVRELLLNVVKHARTDHAKVLMSFSEDDTLTLTVQDQGLGFDVGLLRAKTGGQHFGLLSVLERMEAMGGSFEADSGPGRGTRITLRLSLRPTVEPAPLSVAVNRSITTISQASGVIRVLLVDDHALVRQGLRTVLDRYPDVTIVGEAGNGLEAVAMAADLMPDVILMDIKLPLMDGIEATRRITVAQPGVVVVGLSVNNSAQGIRAMKEAGAATFIPKDDVVEQLHDTIAALATAAGTRRPE
jgi:signal transduction histidine kinase/ActR/RegA family two-component response regulator